jgi:hypothetical protein
MILCDATDGEHICVRDPHTEGVHLHPASENWLKPWPGMPSATEIVDLIFISEEIGKRNRKATKAT